MNHDTTRGGQVAYDLLEGEQVHPVPSRRAPSVAVLVGVAVLAVITATFTHMTILGFFSGEGPISVTCTVELSSHQRPASGTVRYVIEADRAAHLDLGIDVVDAGGVTVTSVSTGGLYSMSRGSSQVVRSFALPADFDVSRDRYVARVATGGAEDSSSVVTSACGLPHAR